MYNFLQEAVHDVLTSSKFKSTKHLLPILLVSILITAHLFSSAVSSSPPRISVALNKNRYYLRENVIIHANLTAGGSQITTSLVGLEIDKPNEEPFIFRAVETNNTSLDSPVIRIDEVTPCVIEGGTPTPKSSFKVGEIVSFNVTVKNTSGNTKPIFLTANVYDSNNVILEPLSYLDTSIPNGTTSWISQWANIPLWASTGNAKVYVNIFTKTPKNDGFPYCKEKSESFTITNPFGVAGDKEYTQEIGSTYRSITKLSSEPIIGEYAVFTTALCNGYFVDDFTKFRVESSSYPPQASFAYWPPEPYVNQTVTFDASASTPDNGTIVSYEWDWESDGVYDATGVTNTTKYETSGTYVVTLNVTDSEGLWGATQKPIKISPPSGPTAGFTYSMDNRTVYFDASYPHTKSGWNGTGYTPIVSYEWSFGDGNTTTVSDPTIIHTYTSEGLYDVVLNVTDELGLWDTVAVTINVTIHEPILGDVNGDGEVNLYDLTIVGSAWDSRPGDPHWDPRADIDGDGHVFLYDLTIVGSNWTG